MVVVRALPCPRSGQLTYFLIPQKELVEVYSFTDLPSHVEFFFVDSLMFLSDENAMQIYFCVFEVVLFLIFLRIVAGDGSLVPGIFTLIGSVLSQTWGSSQQWKINVTTPVLNFLLLWLSGPYVYVCTNKSWNKESPELFSEPNKQESTHSVVALRLTGNCNFTQSGLQICRKHICSSWHFSYTEQNSQPNQYLIPQ